MVGEKETACGEEKRVEGVCSARTWPREWEGLHVCSIFDLRCVVLSFDVRFTRTCANEVLITV
jgi:hypothetical protein